MYIAIVVHLCKELRWLLVDHTARQAATTKFETGSRPIKVQDNREKEKMALIYRYGDLGVKKNH